MGISKALFVLVFFLFVACSDAYTFYVGGREGWVLHPSESYSDWSSRNRFQVNDTLVFKYNKGEDSVLEVSQQDFDQCNLNNPIQKMDTGDSVFKFDRSGPFYFISGTGDRCKQGQKLSLVVLAVRPKGPIAPVNPPMPPTLSPGPNSPVVKPPAISPVSPPTGSLAPSPMLSPPMNSPVSPPTVTPAPSPLFSPPTNSPASPPTVTPAPSPLFSPPTNSPVSPPTVTPAPSPLFSPPTNSPVSPPTVSPAPSPFTVTPPVPSPSLTPSTDSPASGPSTQPSASQTPVTPAPNSNTSPNNPTGTAPVLRLSSASVAVMVLILNYGFFN